MLLPSATRTTNAGHANDMAHANSEITPFILLVPLQLFNLNLLNYNIMQINKQTAITRRRRNSRSILRLFVSV